MSDVITDFRAVAYEDWVEQYEPLPDINGEPKLYEDFGDDQEFIDDVPLYHVWTWIDNGEFSVICSGLVDSFRVGYYLTKVPFESNEMIVVDVEEMESE